MESEMDWVQMVPTRPLRTHRTPLGHAFCQAAGTNHTKSRLVLGAYNQMKISDMKFNPIVKNIDNYVDTAVENANDKNLIEIKNQLKLKAETNLYENKKSITDLENVLNKIVG